MTSHAKRRRLSQASPPPSAAQLTTDHKGKSKAHPLSGFFHGDDNDDDKDDDETRGRSQLSGGEDEDGLPLGATAMNDADEDAEHCAVCLSMIVNKTVIEPCLHGQFCWGCIKAWSDQSRKCPLCLGPIEMLLHNIRSTTDYQKFHLLPLSSSSRGGPTAQEDYLTTYSRHSRRPLSTLPRHVLYGRRGIHAAKQEEDTANWRERREERALERRRYIYREGLFAKHVASNRYTGFKPFTPQRFSNDPELKARVIKFVRRELQVFPTVDVAFLTTYLVSICSQLDLRSSAAVRLISDFLSPEDAEHLAHEIVTFARSPFVTLEGYDRVIQYGRPEREGLTEPIEARPLPTALPRIERERRERKQEDTRLREERTRYAILPPALDDSQLLERQTRPPPGPTRRSLPSQDQFRSEWDGRGRRRASDVERRDGPPPFERRDPRRSGPYDDRHTERRYSQGRLDYHHDRRRSRSQSRDRHDRYRPPSPSSARSRSRSRSVPRRSGDGTRDRSRSRSRSRRSFTLPTRKDGSPPHRASRSPAHSATRSRRSPTPMLDRLASDTRLRSPSNQSDRETAISFLDSPRSPVAPPIEADLRPGREAFAVNLSIFGAAKKRDGAQENDDAKRQSAQVAVLPSAVDGASAAAAIVAGPSTDLRAKLQARLMAEYRTALSQRSQQPSAPKPALRETLQERLRREKELHHSSSAASSSSSLRSSNTAGPTVFSDETRRLLLARLEEEKAFVGANDESYVFGDDDICDDGFGQDGEDDLWPGSEGQDGGLEDDEELQETAEERLRRILGEKKAQQAAALLAQRSGELKQKLLRDKILRARQQKNVA